MNISEQLFKDYCYYRDETLSIKKLKSDGKILRSLKYKPERERLFTQLASWCDEHNVPPRQWLYTLFVTRRWMYSPKLEVNHLCSKNHISKFYAVKDYAFYDKYMNKVNTNIEFDPNIDITATTEARKKELMIKGGGQLCMQFMETETLGYHPKSAVCKECSDRFICNDLLGRKVGFDILKLRG